MECNGIRGNFSHAYQTPDFAALHPGYVTKPDEPEPNWNEIIWPARD